MLVFSTATTVYAAMRHVDVEALNLLTFSFQFKGTRWRPL